MRGVTSMDPIFQIISILSPPNTLTKTSSPHSPAVWSHHLVGTGNTGLFNDQLLWFIMLSNPIQLKHVLGECNTKTQFPDTIQLISTKFSTCSFFTVQQLIIFNISNIWSAEGTGDFQVRFKHMVWPVSHPVFRLTALYALKTRSTGKSWGILRVSYWDAL